MNRWHLPASFASVIVCDFEDAEGSTGNVLRPTCMVALELNSGSVWRLWREELQIRTAAPFDVSASTLFVGFKTEAELTCFLALGWCLPCHVLDLYSEWRRRSNGTPHPLPENSLINVAARYRIDTITAAAKDSFRAMFIANADFTSEQQEAALGYCESDVRATAELFRRMDREEPFRLPAACYRGRYTKAVARVQHVGVPLDLKTERRFRTHRQAIREQIIREGDFLGAYDDAGRFSYDRLGTALVQYGIREWPRTEKNGQLALDRDILRQMARRHPWLEPWRQMKNLVDVLESWNLQCGDDGRGRCSLMPFATLTGRNAPSSTRYVFGLPAGFRPLIKPPPGEAVAYIDYVAQEIGIGAGLCGDPGLLAAFETGDPYLAFAVMAGNAPPGATKDSHPRVRKQHKTALLGVCYGMGVQALAARLEISLEAAQVLLTAVAQLFPVFWAWCRRVISNANWRGEIVTPFDKWRFEVHARTKRTTVRNFMMQASGASIMRLAAIAATEERLTIAGVVHDAFVLVSPEPVIERDVVRLEEIMAEAAEKVCGIAIPAGRKIMRYPERYWDEDDLDGCALWNRLMGLLERVDGQETCSSMSTHLLTDERVPAHP
jgi:DNA polymerase I